MSVENIEVLVEEPSMEAALRSLLPAVLGSVPFRIHPHQGKADLLQHLPSRLRGYARWIPHTWRILVLLDRDNDDCETLKAQLTDIARRAGLATRTEAGARSVPVAIRLAIEELEAWFFGDWDAVCAAYPRVPASIPSRRGFRDPDAIRGGTCEALERILQGVGYFKVGLRKIEAAREIAGHMDPARNRSCSFRAFRDVLRQMSQG